MTCSVRFIPLLTMGLALALTACTPPADPSTQEPVDPAPGLYRITLGGAGLAQYAQQGPGKTEDEVCVTSRESPRFADRAIRNYFVLHPGCTTRPAPRVGNAVSGTITCPLDPKRAAGTVTITYEGVVAADGVEATSRMAFDFQPVPGALGPDEERQVAMATKAMEQVGIRLKAERTGECV